MEYVVAAYAVIWFVLMLYVVSIGLRTARIGRETELLARILAERETEERAPDAPTGVGPAA